MSFIIVLAGLVFLTFVFGWVVFWYYAINDVMDEYHRLIE